MKFGESKQELQMIPQMLRELCPTDLIKQMSAADWKREIVRHYNQDSGNNKIQIIFHNKSCNFGLYNRDW